jgi:Ca2+/H+ antiporter
MDDISRYHELAKDAGNRLRAYILSVSSGATGVFFLALTKTEKTPLSCSEKWLLAIALISFVLTVLLCLYELRIDAKRFFALAKELDKPNEQRNWSQNDSYKSKRYWLIHLSYVTLAIAILATSVYLVLNIIGT